MNWVAGIAFIAISSILLIFGSYLLYQNNSS